MGVTFSQIPRLFRNVEDSLYTHKLLGFTSLIHYGYRFYEWYLYRTMTFSSDKITFFFICIHTLLSISSLIFHVPAVRNIASPMIYPEFRAHSIIFGMRSLLTMFVHWCFLYAGFDILHYRIKACVYRSIIAIGTIIAADCATRLYKPQGSTMRSMPFPNWIPEYVRVYWNMFYSICQVFATLECLMRYNMAHAFMVLFPIQLAAFLMTCVRKSIITAFGWHIYYTLALLSAIAYSITCKTSFSPIELYLYRFFAILFIILRFQFNISKYFLWTTILITYNLHKYYIF